MEKVTSWRDLTLREKIGQTVVCLCETEKHIEMCGSIEGFAKKYPIGGIFNNNGIVKGLMTGLNSSFGETLAKYNENLRVPLFGVGDFGTYAEQIGVSLPPQMALGACDDKELSYSAGEFIAHNSKKSGINWILWPVCDLNMSKYSPVVNTRAVSDKWELNARVVKEEIKALKDNNVISCLKHYPGVPHDEDVDSHLAPYDNETPMEIWYENYGKMYKEIFKDNPPSIMTAHNNLVKYQTEKIDGVYPGATLSYELTTKLLREELGFKGVVVTDALVMGGFAGNQAADRCIDSFMAGNDVLLWPVYEYIDEMEKRILSGEIDESILDAAVERIWNMKKEYGIIDGTGNTSEVSDSFFADIESKISEKCLTLVNDVKKVLPVDKNKVKNVLVVGVTPDDKQYESLCGLKNEFEKYGCSVTMQKNAWTDDVEKAADAYDLIVFALCRSPHRPIGPLDFWGEEATSIWASNCSDKSKTVIGSFGTPYMYKYYKNSNIPYINAYSWTPKTLAAFVKAVFGDLPFEGKSSVEL